VTAQRPSSRRVTVTSSTLLSHSVIVSKRSVKRYCSESGVSARR
jgi:hypothetical protein